MSDTTTTQEHHPGGPASDPDAAADPAAAAAAQQDVAQEPHTDLQEPRDGREAAKYRRQLREAEAARDGLAERLAAMQRRVVERLAAAELATPADLWLTGVGLSDLLDDDGDLDEDKVRGRVAEVLADRPGWRRTVPPDFDGGTRTPAPREASWSDVIGSAKR